MGETASDVRKYLDPRTLARVGSLDLRARLIVEGLMTGMHRSPYQGASVEFAQHRQYVVGDASESMGFGSVEVDGGAKWTKYDHCTAIAAAMAYLGIQQQDSVGLAI